MNFDDKSPEYRAGMMVGIVFIIAFAAYIILLNHSKAYGQDVTSMANNMAQHVVMCRQKYNNEDLLYKFCRKSNEDFGVSCDENMAEYSEYIIKYATLYRIDPWLFAAIAYNESKFDAYLVGKVKKERGIFQIHPGNKHSIGSKFIHNRKYRIACRARRGHCQEEVVHIAAKIFNDAMEACGGDIKQALSAYNQGECFPLRKGYISSVMTYKKSLMSLDKLEVNWCSSGV